MSNVDKRKVSTDALETLGQINSCYVEKFETIAEEITEWHFDEFNKFWRNFTILTGIEPINNHSILDVHVDKEQ
jgi:hypothetical protein